MLTVVIINESEPEKQDKFQISKKQVLQIVRFWIKTLQRVRFLFKVFPTRLVLIQSVYIASDVDLKFLQRVSFWI